MRLELETQLDSFRLQLLQAPGVGPDVPYTFGLIGISFAWSLFQVFA